MKNNSQLEDLRRTPQENYEKRLRIDKRNPIGIESTLGHAYSLILEKLSREGLDDKPDLEGFIQYFINDEEELIYKDRGHISVWSRCFYPENTRVIIKYSREKGLTEESIDSLLYDLIGPNPGFF